MSTARDLVASAVLHLPAALVGDVVLFGSAAIALHGVNLGRDPNDVDMFVSQQTFDRWPVSPAREFIRDWKEPGHLPRIVAVAFPALELWCAFPGVTFDAVAHAATTMSLEAPGTTHGPFGAVVRVAALDDLLAWKRAQRLLRSDGAGRAKDERDIERIEAFLAENRLNR